MKTLDRAILALIAATAAAAVLPTVVGPLVTLAVVATACFAVVQLVRYLTTRW